MFVNDLIKKEILKLFNQAARTTAGFKRLEATEDLIEIPPDQKMGDFALPCFSFSKQIGKSPNYIADQLQEIIFKKAKNATYIKTVSNVGPYLNFFIKPEEVNKLILNKIKTEKSKYGNADSSAQKEKAKKGLIMIEFSQPNTHKEFHIGHLRNAFIGDSLVKILKSQGYKIMPVNYIGDAGVHVAKCLWGLQNWHTDSKGKIKGVAKIKNKGEFLGKVYAKANQEYKRHEAVRKEVSQVHQGLMKEDKKLIALWKQTRKWSLDEFMSAYKELNIKFDHFFYESEEEKEGLKMLPKLLKESYIYESNGAVIADLKKFNLDVLVLRKYDGTVLYGLKDVPLAIKKVKKYKADILIYVVDSRQSLYLKQIFKILELQGIENKKIHIAYEFVTLEHGVMSSREGNVVTYEFLKDKLTEKAIFETKLRHKDWSKKKIEDVAEKLALASMKFDMLRQGNNKPIIFSINRAVRFSGCTGPYMLYTYARINSILKKAGIKGGSFGKINYGALKKDQEMALIKQLTLFHSFLENVTQNYNPSDLVNYLFGLTKSFSFFYQEVPILKSEDKERNARLMLIYCVSLVLKRGLELLGIETIEEM